MLTKKGAKIAEEKQKKEPIVASEAANDMTNVSKKKDETKILDWNFIVLENRKVRTIMANPTKYHFWCGKGQRRRLFGF